MQTLREAREARGIKQQAVAEAIGMTRQAYAQHEDDCAKMPFAKMAAACKFIGCDVNEIFFANIDNSIDMPD